MDICFWIFRKNFFVVFTIWDNRAYMNARLLTLFPFGYSLEDNWNDRRSRRVFLCFCWTIFKLMSEKFPTFAWTVRSCFMKFWQQFEINELDVLLNFEAISHVTSVSGPGNYSESLAWKTVSFKHGLSTTKNISHGYMFYDTLSSLPTHFWPQCGFLFFVLFFLPKSCTLF